MLLGFSVDRSGRVLTRRVVQSSGHPDLSQEVMEMVMRAQPLPAFPPSMTQSELDLTVPISFTALTGCSGLGIRACGDR